MTTITTHLLLLISSCPSPMILCSFVHVNWLCWKQLYPNDYGLHHFVNS